ncbi:MAG: glycosyltransferase family 4 protein [Ktedonobacteraceae bacterium]
MRIALVAPLVTPIAQPYAGGAQAMLADLARGLLHRGHTVTLFARAESFVPDVAIKQITVPESVRPANFGEPAEERPTDSGFFAQANLFLDLFLHLQQHSHEFDIVHAHAFDWPAFACSVLVHDIPVLHTLHLSAISSEINTALAFLHRQGHPLTLLTVSHSCATSYAPYTPIDAVIYNGLDLDIIPFAEQVAPDAPLLFAGRITPEKGVEAAIEIAEQAGRRLLIAGGIYDQSYYQERILPKLRQTGERVTYLGQLERAALWQLMSQSLGLLFPIEWDEPFGLTPVEAMATGTPVIAYRRGAVEEIIRHSETGFLVVPGDRGSAAASVKELHSLSRMQCRRHVECHFSLGRMLDAHETVYMAVAEGFKRRGA